MLIYLCTEYSSTKGLFILVFERLFILVVEEKNSFVSDANIYFVYKLYINNRTNYVHVFPV